MRRALLLVLAVIPILRGQLAPLTLPTKRTTSPYLTSLRLYCKLEEASGVTCEDSHTNNYDLTDINTVGTTTGKIGSAKVFVPAGLDALSNTSDHKETGDFTAGAWVNPTSLSGGDSTYGRGIYSVHNSDAIGDQALGVKPDGSVVFMYWKSTGSDTTGRHTTSSTALVATGVWTSVIVRRSSGVSSIWINGVSKAFTSAGTASGWGNTQLKVGRQFAGSTYTWDGAIDEFFMADRAWTDQEILDYVTNVLSYPF